MSKIMKTRKFQKTVSVGKNDFQDENLSVSLHLCFDYEICTQTKGGQYCLLSAASPPAELVLLHKFQLQNMVHARIVHTWSKPRPILCFRNFEVAVAK